MTSQDLSYSMTTRPEYFNSDDAQENDPENDLMKMIEVLKKGNEKKSLKNTEEEKTMTPFVCVHTHIYFKIHFSNFSLNTQISWKVCLYLKENISDNKNRFPSHC